MKFGNHLMLYIFVLLCVISIGISFYRFIVKNDYIVQYDAACDPLVQKCFVSCNDDACEDKNYHMKVKKREQDIHTECGPDVTDCEEASVCLPTDIGCSIEYCSPETLSNDETCEDIDETNNVDSSQASNEEEDAASTPINEKIP